MKEISLNSTFNVEKSTFRVNLSSLLASEKFVIPALCACIVAVLTGAAMRSTGIMATAGVAIIACTTPLFMRYIDEDRKEDAL